jgi:N-acyl-D-amino-acid deacylase
MGNHSLMMSKMLHNTSGRIPLHNTPCPLTLDFLFINAKIYDGTGSEPFYGQVGVKKDKIVYVGRNLDPDDVIYKNLIDCEKKYSLCPGFINMLSWATETLIEDGRSLSDLLQGI